MVGGPKYMDGWPKDGPPRLWQSERIPSCQEGGCGSPVVADGKVLLYADWRHPIGDATNYHFISRSFGRPTGLLRVRIRPVLRSNGHRTRAPYHASCPGERTVRLHGTAGTHLQTVAGRLALKGDLSSEHLAGAALTQLIKVGTSAGGARAKAAPAYDVTHAHNPEGLWTNQHLMAVNGKFTGITRADLLSVADRFGIGTAAKVIEQVGEAVTNWPDFAARARVSPQESARICEHLHTEHCRTRSKRGLQSKRREMRMHINPRLSIAALR